MLTPNGKSDKKLVIEVDGIPRFVYAVYQGLEVGYNLVSFHNKCTASRCLHGSEELGWNQTAYILPDDEVDAVPIIADSCSAFQLFSFPVNNTVGDLQWHSLTFDRNYSFQEQEACTPILVDGNEITCLPKSRSCISNGATVQIYEASVAIGCDPTMAASASRLPQEEFSTIFLVIFSWIMTLISNS